MKGAWGRIKRVLEIIRSDPRSREDRRKNQGRGRRLKNSPMSGRLIVVDPIKRQEGTYTRNESSAQGVTSYSTDSRAIGEGDRRKDSAGRKNPPRRKEDRK